MQQLSIPRRIIFYAVTLMFTAICVELCLQVFYRLTVGEFLFRRTLPPIYAVDDTRCYSLRPNLDYEHRTNEFVTQIYTNGQGFRTDSSRSDIEVPKPQGVYRVLFLGPSFAFGWASDYEDTYAALIADRLRVPGKRVELMNLGTPAQGPSQQACWVSGEGAKFEPDLVVQTTYGREVDRFPDSCPHDLSCPIIEEGHLYQTRPTLARRVIARAKNIAAVFYGYTLLHALAGTDNGEELGTGKELHASQSSVAEGEIEELVKSIERYIAFLRFELGEGTQVAFIHVPLSFMVHRGDVARWKHLIDADPSTARSRVEQEVAALRERGLPIVATTRALTEAGREARMFYWLDIHLTPAGNKVVAETALPILQAMVDSAVSRSERTELMGRDR
jgi:hypothetical protein